MEVRPETLQILEKDATEKEFRDQQALELKILGKSFREIGRLFNVSGQTAKKWVKAAQEGEQLKRAQGIVGMRLVPKALAVYDQQLERGDLEAARDILFGAGILSKSQKVTVTQELDPLEAFRRKFFTEDVVEALPAHDPKDPNAPE